MSDGGFPAPVGHISAATAPPGISDGTGRDRCPPSGALAHVLLIRASVTLIGAGGLLRPDRSHRQAGFPNQRRRREGVDRQHLRFGGTHTSTGAPPENRFPARRYQSGSGLYRNWMRDYDPTTGRYLQADPLGLVGGASVCGYMYVRQNPGRWSDPHGEFIPTIVIAGAAIGAAVGYSETGCGRVRWFAEQSVLQRGRFFLGLPTLASERLGQVRQQPSQRDGEGDYRWHNRIFRIRPGYLVQRFCIG